MNAAPAFLLLMPSYNQGHYIAQALDSVLAQDDSDWQLWIVDNSSDDTPEVVTRYRDPRIRFHHFPERMDPGSCLNWMLERVEGRDFSYLHADNNLHPGYVRQMRAALARGPLTLAYCDMRTIDHRGRPLALVRRGRYDLPRLLSTDSLGVPFAATTELASRVGGFSANDLADDVRFCVSAYGIADYVPLPAPLVDYRVHSGSRTEAAGGSAQVQNRILEIMPKVLPELEQRGLDPVRAMAESIRAGLDELDWFVEDLWYRKLTKLSPAWWQGPPTAGALFAAGLLPLREFSKRLGAPPLRWSRPATAAGPTLWPWQGLAVGLYLRTRARELQRIAEKPARVLASWAYLQLGGRLGESRAFRIATPDFRTVWAARQLEVALGWTPRIEAAASSLAWTTWARACGDEPLLDCAALPRLGPAA